MKRSSLTTKATSRRTSHQSRRQVITIIGVALALFLAIQLLPRLVHGVSSLVFAPIGAVKSWVQYSSDSLPQYLRDRTQLIDQMHKLQQQLADKNNDHLTTDQLLRENTELRQLLGNTADSRILAAIIGRPAVLPYDVLMIDRGSDDGIVENAPVYIGSHTVVGFISSVNQHTALITLITTPDFHSTVYVVGPDIYAMAVGQGGGQIRIGIPQGVVVKEGDTVILPAITSGIYGVVNHVENEPSQPEQFAYVSPNIPLSSLRFVAVGKTPLQGVDVKTAASNVQAALSDLFVTPVPKGASSTPEAVASSTASTTRATTSTTH